MLMINCMKIFGHQKLLYDIVEFSVRVVRQNYHSVLSSSKQLLVTRWLGLEFMLFLIEGVQPYKDEKQHTLHTFTFSSLMSSLWKYECG
jgi:hypothetical protein